MRPVRLLAALAFAASLSLVACGGDSTAPGSNLSGTYNLRTINGASLPFTDFQDANFREEITSAVITASGGSFTESTTMRDTENGSVTTLTSADAGSYSINGTAVSFVFNSGSSGTGTIAGNTLTVAAPGFSSLFVHQ